MMATPEFFPVRAINSGCEMPVESQLSRDLRGEHIRALFSYTESTQRHFLTLGYLLNCWRYNDPHLACDPRFFLRTVTKIIKQKSGVSQANYNRLLPVFWMLNPHGWLCSVGDGWPRAIQSAPFVEPERLNPTRAA